MKKETVYIFTFFAIALVVGLISIFSVHYVYQTTESQLLHAQLQSSKREAREIARLLEQQLQQGIPQAQVQQQLQNSIENTDTQSEFICMYNTQGIELCHPDPTHIGQVITKDNSVIAPPEQNLTDFLALLQKGETQGGVRTFKDHEHSEIIYIHPVATTNWMVAAHANLAVIHVQLDQLYHNLLLIYIAGGLLIVVGCFVAVRFINATYERRMETEKNELQWNVVQLQSLNEQLEVHKTTLEQQLHEEQPLVKSRLLVYKKDELISLATQDIAWIQTEQQTTRIMTLQQQLYYTHDSLDELLKSLDANVFFRVNRQFIVHIKAIAQIIRYGKNQLKLVVHPDTDVMILISKHKVAEFKSWLNQ
ncbi:LytR/AlgR family response regulator transcription factor [Zhouia sp. PK063]|uniref:LytR/AlgR family response regulator transcription factor n=1 Tax=Zhouia sp. PK063 TaxID=3373602 RepID=UPI0037A8E7BD